jgi:hypothetical protein
MARTNLTFQDCLNNSIIKSEVAIYRKKWWNLPPAGFRKLIFVHYVILKTSSKDVKEWHYVVWRWMDAIGGHHVKWRWVNEGD